MALVVEDGTGIAGAESYASLAGALAYWASRAHDANAAAWSASTVTDDKREGALREATAYLDATYGQRYRGRRATLTQGLLWPRLPWPTDPDCTTASTVLLDPDGLELPGLPKQIVSATIELAVRALTRRLAQDVDPNGRLKSERAADHEMVYALDTPTDGSFGFVDRLLLPVLDGSSGGWNWR